MEPSVCLSDEADFDAQNAALQDYGQYTTVYPNSSLYATKTSAAGVVGVSRMGSQCNYRSDHNSGKIIGSQSNLTSSVQELSNPLGVPLDQGAMMAASTIRYMQPSQYEEMSEYGINPVMPFSHDPQYGEEAPVAYGYVSEANYVMPSVGAKTNAYAPPRPPMFDDNRNGAEASAMGLAQQGFEDPHDFQNKMSQLTISSFGIVSQQMRNGGVGVGINSIGGKEDIIDGSCSDICSTMRWRDPNLSEVISFLNNPNNAIKANAAAYLQHLCYMDDPIKQRTRILGGIPPLIRLLSYEAPEIYKYVP